MNNVAYSKEYEEEKKILSDKLSEYLKVNQDPRKLGEEMKWIGAKYFAEKDFYPSPSEEARIELNLEEEYSHIEK
jgi:hypothetical protein